VFKPLVNGWQRRGSAKSDRKGSKSARLRRNRVARRIRSGFYFGVPRLHSLPVPTSSGPCSSNGANQFPIDTADPPGALVPAVSFFGGFRTPALVPVDRSALAGIRNPSHNLPHALQKIRAALTITRHHGARVIGRESALRSAPLGGVLLPQL
jgi:hypothetical protein